MTSELDAAIARPRVEVRANRIRLIRTLNELTPRPTRLTGGLGAGRVIAVYHLYVVYTDPRGRQFYYRGGPERDLPPFGPITTRHGLYVPGTPDWATDAVAVTLAEGAAAQGLDSSFRSTLAGIEALRIPYNPLGPNSNTVVKTLLAECGLPVAQPVALAPGFDHPSLLEQ